MGTSPELKLLPGALGQMVDVSEGLPRDLAVEFSADPELLSAVSDILGGPVVSDLEGQYALVPAGRRHYRLTGRVRGRITQACVVTGEPVEQAIDETIDAEFWPEQEVESWQKAQETLAEPDGFEPESYSDDEIPLGQYVYEVFALAIDPYPRKDGVDFDGATEGGEDGQDNPFAVLKNLKV